MTNPEKNPTEICLALGGNIGDRLAALLMAKEALAPFISNIQTSAIYETLPAYETDQPLFLNASLRGKTLLSPQELLKTLKKLEEEIGRRPTFHYGPRVIDLDILFYGDTLVNEENLTIPHALMSERFFVLKPLCDVAADWVHPQFHKTVLDLFNALPEKEAIKIIKEKL